MEHRYVAEVAAAREDILAVLDDVAGYDRWLDFVQRVEPDHTVDNDPAWFFTLRARIGPLARSKRLRVVETITTTSRVRLERSECDDRDHAPWIFDASLTDGKLNGDKLADGTAPASTTVTITLTYGGRLWTSALNTVLDNQLDTATERLRSLAAER